MEPRSAALGASLGLSAGLSAAVEAAPAGPTAALAAANARIGSQSLVKLDYLVIVHPLTLLTVPGDYRGPARMLVAARVGATRLIDNVSLTLG